MYTDGSFDVTTRRRAGGMVTIEADLVTGERRALSRRIVPGESQIVAGM